MGIQKFEYTSLNMGHFVLGILVNPYTKYQKQYLMASLSLNN